MKRIDDIKKDKNVIALSGKSQTGKTLCLQMLISKLIMDDCIYSFENGITDFMNSSIPIKTKGRGANRDYIMAFKKDQKTVGIITAGDSEKELIQGFENLEDYNCDVYVCACHQYGKTIQFLEDMTNSGNLIIHNRWEVKTTINNDKYTQSANDRQVQELLNEINDF